MGSDNSVTLTRAEYDALSDEEKDSNTTYYISDEGAQPNAFSVPFTSDKYTATNTGDALIEVKSEIADVNSNLPYLKMSPLVDSNGNQLSPNSFHDSALSIGYSHGTISGLDVTAYIPIITMRWYDSSENIRTIQYALSGITTYIRYSVSSTEWSNWTSGATQSQIDSINSNLMNQSVYLWEVGGSTGSKQIDLSQYRFVLITIMVEGFTTQCMLKPSNLQSSSTLGYQTQVGVNTANGYVAVNMTYDGTTFAFSCDSTIILDVIGIN